jgi:ABC-type glycerol-3-phosphate transport system permease component
MDVAARLRKSKLRKNLNFTFVTAFAAAALAIFLLPFLYMIVSSLKTHAQMTALNAPIWPATYLYFPGDEKRRADRPGHQHERL